MLHQDVQGASPGGTPCHTAPRRLPLRPSGKRGGAGVGWGRVEARWAACANSPAPARSRSPRASACTSWRRRRAAGVVARKEKEGRGRCRERALRARQCGVERREVDGGRRRKAAAAAGALPHCVLARRGPALALAPLPMRWALAVLAAARTPLAATLQTVSTIRTSSRA